MENFLNIIIIGEELELITDTLKSIKEIIDLKKIRIIIITPQKTNLEKISFTNNKNIFLFNDDGKGIFQAMNLGLSYTKFDNSYIWFLNSGDFAEKYYLKNKVLSILQTRKNDPDIIFYIIKNKLTVINILYWIFKKLNINDKNIIKIFMIFLIFPASHQNIFIKKYLHKEFDLTYKVSSDFELIAEIIFKKNKSIRIEEGSIGQTSKGGHSEMNKYKGIKERYFILREIFKTRNQKITLVFLKINLLLRIFILYGVDLIKNLKKYFYKLF